MSASDERLDTLRRRAREAGHASTWIAEPGDELAGVVEAVDRVTHADAVEVDVLVVTTPDGARLAWHARGVVAAQRVAECRPRPGDLIVILREPDRVSGAGRTYRSWTVEVDHGTGELEAGTGPVAALGVGDDPTGSGDTRFRVSDIAEHDPTGDDPGWDADDPDRAW